MSLLPKNAKFFTEDSYWNQFFEKRGKHAFEWYGEYPELSTILHKYVKTTDKMLSVGCGNSTLSENLYDLGYRNNVNIDISNTVIKQMKEKHGAQRPDLEFHLMDVQKMAFDDGLFSVVIDKGTLDAVLPDSSADALKTAGAMLEEINRVLRFGGRYICVSLLQKHILSQLLDCSIIFGWMVRIHRCLEAEQKDYSSKQFSFPVFVIICTKMKAIPGLKQVLEFVSNDTTPVERLESRIELISLVESLQQYAFLCHQLNTKKTKDDVSLDLYSKSNKHPRYTVFVVDSRKNESMKYGVFIVPQGRETEWLFSTNEGRQQLAHSAKSERLLVVHLNRNQTYESLEKVKSEISERALDFAPTKLTKSSQVPIMSLGESIGTRNIVFKGSSVTTGEYVIEDVELDGDIYRRLIFSSNQHVIQSEAKMHVVKKKNKSKNSSSKLRVDLSHLACQHHVNMIAGLALLPQILKHSLKILIVGLGGGSLPSHIQSYVKNTSLDVVDIDETIVSIAKEWFNFCPNERMQVFVEDGIQFITKAAESGTKYDAIFFDVDNKDTSDGLSVPPPSFLELEFLKTVRTSLSESGIFILNLVCRSEVLKKDIHNRLRSVFGTFWYKQMPEEVNEIIYMIVTEDSSSLPNYYKDNLIQLNRTVKQQINKDLIDITDGLKLISFGT